MSPKSIIRLVKNMIKTNYFDLIRINTEMSIDDLIDTVDIHNLRRFVDDIEVYETNELLKMKNLTSCLALHQATDEAISYLQGLVLGRSTIPRIEVAQDIQFESKNEADTYIKEFQENNYMRFSTGNMRCGNTLYMGKEEGEQSTIYNVSYVPVKKKLGKINVAHIEFVIHLNRNVQRILKIKNIYELRSAEEHFNELYDKYIVKAKINKNRFNKHFPSCKANNIEELVSVVSGKKNSLREIQQKNTTLNIICDKRMKEHFGVKDSVPVTDQEELILNQSFRYFVKPF